MHRQSQCRAADVKRLSWILTLPLLIVAVAFSVANRESITLDLWPLEMSISVPLFAALLLSLLSGLLIGGLAAWLSAGRSRRRAREARRRAERLERELAQARRDLERASAAPAAGSGGADLPAARGEAGERGKLSATGT